MATYNGARFLHEQIASILCQLAAEDELIISDDASSDDTPVLVRSFDDPRIRFFTHPRLGVARNFECALGHARGDIVFLSDQDDVWMPDKIARMCAFMERGGYQCIMCNCQLVDAGLGLVKSPHFDASWPMQRSFWHNLYNNAWLGCCMAFRRQVLEQTLPFPRGLAAHDLWIALYAQWHFRCGYMQDDVLVSYRRHESTVSFTGSKSNNPLWFRIYYRVHIFCHLLWRSLLRTLHPAHSRKADTIEESL